MLCLACHESKGQGRADIKAPAIAGLPSWYVEKQITNFRTGLRGKHVDDIAGMRMRPMARSIQPKDIKAVSDYVASLKPVETKITIKGDKVAGQASYAVCLACHGDKGQGNEALGAPSFKGADDWYLKTQLLNFKSGVRGAVEGDTGGMQMAPMAGVLADEAAIDNVITYIKSLK